MAELRQWELDALDTRQEKRITVLDAEQYDPGFPPAPLARFKEYKAKQEEAERHALAVLKAKYEKEQGTNA